MLGLDPNAAVDFAVRRGARASRCQNVHLPGEFRARSFDRGFLRHKPRALPADSASLRLSAPELGINRPRPILPSNARRSAKVSGFPVRGWITEVVLATRAWLCLAYLISLVPIFSTALAAPPAAVVLENPASTIEAKARALARRAADSADAGQAAPELPEQAAELGVAAALACLEFLDDAHPLRRRPLHAVIAAATVGRAWPAEILRHYDPAAWHLFYHADGRREQERLGACLQWSVWEPATTEVLVRAAPVPALAWLEQQARAPEPAFDHLLALWKTWGLWVRSGRELQHLDALGHGIAKLATNAAVLRHPAARAALAKFAGECEAGAAVPFLSASLRTGETAEIRGHAAIALGRCGGADALAALTRHAALEGDAAVLVKLAAALETWPEDATAGATLLAMFERVPEPAVRRSVLFAAISGRWPQRSALVLRALREDAGGVAGVALLAAAARAEPAARESVLAFAAAARTAQPNLIDALGALREPRAGEILSRWALVERNVSLQLKLVQALRAVGGADVRATLVKLLQTGTDGLVVEHIILALEELAVADAVPMLLTLAADGTAPVGVRLQAIRALGVFPRPEVRALLAGLTTRVEAEFGVAEEGASRGAREDRIEQARVYLAIARLRLGAPAAADEIGRTFARGTASVRFITLQLLGALKQDHAVIRDGLNAGDFAVLLAAVTAARRTQPASYRAELERLAAGPFIRGLGQSGVDALNFEDLLGDALEAAGGRRTKPAGGHR